VDVGIFFLPGITNLRYHVYAKAPPHITNADILAGECVFPLKQGSKNDCVKKLQQALIANLGAAVLPKYGADGTWGSETQKAMANYTGVSIVPTDANLQQIINLMGTNLQASIPANKNLSEKLITDFNEHKYLYIVCNDSLPWAQMVFGTDQRWHSSPYIIKVHAGLRISTKDYSVMNIPNPDNGYIMIECNKGTNKGYWQVPPTKVRFE
jgi:hypothetical protein